MKLKLNIHYIIQRIKLALIFPLPCTVLCGKPLRRVHITCLWCRLRRLQYGHLDSETNFKIGSLVFNPCLNVPVNHEIYVLFIDTYRPFHSIKDKFLQIILKIAEALSHTEGVKETVKISELAFHKGLIVPRKHTLYGLYIDNARRFQPVKERLLKGLLTIAEGFAN